MKAGFALVPDPRRQTQVLLTATAPSVGIESPELQRPDAPNLWSNAWEARSYLTRRAHRAVPDQAVGLAVNSLPGRTQDRLHIHIDCLRRSARAVIDASLPEITDGWSELSRPFPRGRRYRALWLNEAALATSDPFKLLAADPVVGDEIAAFTLVMVAAETRNGTRGFVILDHKANTTIHDLGAGEELLDHKCAALAR